MIPFNLLAWLHGKDYRKPETKEAAFRHQLCWGRHYELMVGAFLTNCGISVSMAAATDVEKQKERKSVPDLFADGYRIECKSTKLAQLPKLVPLESVRAYKNKQPKPDFYVLVSKKTWKMVWVPGNNPKILKPGRAHAKPYYLVAREHFRPIQDLVALLKHPRFTLA